MRAAEDFRDPCRPPGAGGKRLDAAPDPPRTPERHALYEVTIWFMVEGEAVSLATANRKRQWPRNVAVPGDAPQAGLAAVPGNSHHTEL